MKTAGLRGEAVAESLWEGVKPGAEVDTGILLGLSLLSELLGLERQCHRLLL